MIFTHRDKEQKQITHTLTEADIRNRLYGSAVGIVVDAQEQFSKKGKDREGKKASIKKEPKDEQNKIHKELESLKKELEQAKCKLNRIRGLRTKKLRIFAAYLTIFLIAATLTAAAVKRLIFAPKRPTQTVISKLGMIYSIQVAVYGNAADAQKFNSELNSKGYQTFIKESYFKSGKEKFVVYAGRFQDRINASRILTTLKTKEGLRDCFITSAPE